MRVPGTIGRRTVLLGAVSALAVAGVVITAAPAFAATTPLTLNSIGGPSEGGNVITGTVTSAVFTAGDPTKSYVQFQWRTGSNLTCTAAFGVAAPITYASGLQTAGIIDVPTTSVTVPDAQTLNITVPSALLLGGAVGLYNVCVYPGTNTTTSLLIADTATAVGYGLSPYKVGLSGYQGPAGGGNMIIATLTGATFTGAFGVQLQNALGGYCRPLYGTAVSIGAAAGVLPITSDVTVLVPTKVAITIPSALLLVGVTTANYNLCIYSSTDATTGTLIAGTALPYVIAAASTVTGVTPTSGPAQGGTLITVTGTAFAAGMTVMLAGQPLTGYTLSGTTSFTVRTPPHAAGGPFSLLVTTAAGPAAVVPAVGKTTNFVYTNGITVVPTTAANSSFARTWMDIQGVGFADLQFTTTTGTTSNDAKAHVYLSKGAYDPKPTTATPPVKTNPQTLECVDVVPISDTELICGLYLAGNQTSTTTTRTVTGCTATSGSTALIGSACLFTAADIGMAVTGTGIAPNTGTGTPAPNASTTILSVGSTGATLSKLSTAAVSGNLTLTSSRTLSDVVLASPTTITSTLVPFNAADVGKAVSGTGIPNGAVITDVTGVIATLSVTVTAVSAPAVAVFTPYPVPIATYTVTVVNNGTVNAQATAGYSQSIISSGSTFTVADYLR